MAELPTVAALWIGGSLTWLEQLCLKSFVDAGQPVTLYTYEPVGNAPPGVALKDAGAILQAEGFHRHERTGSVALFSDLFRFHLMRKAPGEIWIDTDIYCWRPITAETPFIFGYETSRQINGAVLGLPPDSDALAEMLTFMEDEHPIAPFLSPKAQEEARTAAAAGAPIHVSALPWGIWGPLGVTWFLKKTGEARFARPEAVYYPVHYRDRNLFFKRPMKAEAFFTDETKTVHLWARIKKVSGLSHGGYAPKGSFLAKLLEKHEIDQTKARIMRHGNKVFDHTEFDAEQAGAPAGVG